MENVSARPQAHDDHELFGLEALVPARVRHVQALEDNVSEEHNGSPDELRGSNCKHNKGAEGRRRVQRASDIIPRRDAAHVLPKLFELGPARTGLEVERSLSARTMLVSTRAVYCLCCLAYVLGAPTAA